MKKQWTMVRVTKETHSWLEALRTQMEADYQAGRIRLPDRAADHVSMDYVIAELIVRVLKHRRRAKRCKAARRDAKEGQG